MVSVKSPAIIRLLIDIENQITNMIGKLRVNGQYQKQHILDTLKRYITDITNADDSNIYDRLITLGHYLSKHSISHKTFSYDTELKNTLDQAWNYYTEISNALPLSDSQQNALNHLKMQYTNHKLADGLIEHLKILNPKETIEEGFPTKPFPKQISPLQQLTFGEKINNNKRIIAYIKVICTAILKNDIQKAVRVIDELDQFMHARIKNADHTQTMRVLNNLKHQLNETYPHLNSDNKSQNKLIK